MKTFERPLFEWHVSWSSWIPPISSQRRRTKEIRRCQFNKSPAISRDCWLKVQLVEVPMDSNVLGVKRKLRKDGNRSQLCKNLQPKRRQTASCDDRRGRSVDKAAQNISLTSLAISVIFPITLWRYCCIKNEFHWSGGSQQDTCLNFSSWEKEQMRLEFCF